MRASSIHIRIKIKFSQCFLSYRAALHRRCIQSPSSNSNCSIIQTVSTSKTTATNILLGHIRPLKCIKLFWRCRYCIVGYFDQTTMQIFGLQTLEIPIFCLKSNKVRLQSHLLGQLRLYFFLQSAKQEGAKNLM